MFLRNLSNHLLGYTVLHVTKRQHEFLCLCFVVRPVKKTELTAGGIRCADHATPSIRKSWH
jgi:hypothetical protein